VVDHLFGAIDLLLSAHPIAALKWDHNRDLFPAASREGHRHMPRRSVFTRCSPCPRRASPCRDRGLRERRRADRLCDRQQVARVWASDNTDAVERLRIIAR
jgi:alpha-galactosidase